MKSTPPSPFTRQLLVLLLLMLLGWQFVLPFLTEPIAMKEKQLIAAKNRIDELQDRVGVFIRCVEQTREFGKDSLPSDYATAAVRYQDWLRQTCSKLGIESPKILVREPSNIEGVGSRVKLMLTAEATAKSAGDLIDAMSVAPLAQRIVRTKMSDWSSVSNTIRLELELEAIAMVDNPTFDAMLFARAYDLRGFGPFLDQRRHFARFTPHSASPTIAKEAEPSPVPIAVRPRTPSIDALNMIKFVGMMERDGMTRALFRDSKEQTDLLVSVHGELKVDGFVATLERFEDDAVVLRYGKNWLTVTLGQTLRQGLKPETEFRSVQ